MNVMVINQYAGNKGDRAVIYFVTRELARNGITDITVSTHDRSFWNGSSGQLPGGVRLVPWGWNVERPEKLGLSRWRRLPGRRTLTRRICYPIVRSQLLKNHRMGCARFLCNQEFYRSLKAADVVISTGGHMLTTRFAPDAVTGTTYDMMLVLLARRPLVLWSQTVGPLRFVDERNKMAVRRILLEAEEVIVRDSASLREVVRLAVPLSRVSQTYESVMGLNDVVPGYVPPSKRERTIGITVYNAEARTHDEYSSYVRVIAALADRAAEDGFRVVFFPHEVRGAVIDDRRCIRDVIGCARHADRCEMEDEDIDTAGHLLKVAQCRMFVGHKTHSIVFALTVGTPVLALSYHVKTLEFMRQYGLAPHCLTDSDLGKDDLIRTYEKVTSALDDCGRQQFERSREFGRAVRRDFAAMLTRRAANAGSPQRGRDVGQHLKVPTLRGRELVG